MNAIKEFKELCMVETFSKKIYIISWNAMEVLDDMIENNKFVMLSGKRVNTSAIEEYWLIPSNSTYDFIVALPENTRSIAMRHLKDHEKETKKMPEPKILANYLKKHFDLSFWADPLHKFKWIVEAVLHTLHEKYPNN